MSSYDFILDSIKFSYSSTSLYKTCPYSFKLSYIDVAPKVSNFFSEYGTLIHKCMEGYFRGYFEPYELSDYYRNNFGVIIKSPPPPYPLGMEEKYREQGQMFFDNFSFNKTDFDIVLIEKKINFILNGFQFVAMPDLVLKDKKTNKQTLFDYKSATPFWTDKQGREKRDEKKIKGYTEQMLIYAHALRTSEIGKIDKIILWFPRLNKMLDISDEIQHEDTVIASLSELVDKIKSDDAFNYNNSNLYFCENLCSVRNMCEYR